MATTSKLEKPEISNYLEMSDWLEMDILKSALVRKSSSRYSVIDLAEFYQFGNLKSLVLE